MNLCEYPRHIRLPRQSASRTATYMRFLALQMFCFQHSEGLTYWGSNKNGTISRFWLVFFSKRLKTWGFHLGVNLYLKWILFEEQWFKDRWFHRWSQKNKHILLRLLVGGLSVQMQVQTYSGCAGIYVEPRAIDGRQSSTQFQVVWLPKMEHQDLIVLRQMHPSVCGLALMGMKLGLRCRTEHAASLHTSVKPSSSYLPQGKKCCYLVGPVPYGTLRASIAGALSSVGWKVRPLQTAATSRNVEGIMWRVQAVEDPPCNIIQLQHGEVLVTKLEDPQVSTMASVQVVGSDRTSSCVQPILPALIRCNSMIHGLHTRNNQLCLHLFHSRWANGQFRKEGFRSSDG